MKDGEQLRYGWIGGGKTSVPVKMYASERVDAPGGKFVNMNATGYAEYLDDGDGEEIFGSAEVAYGSQSATQVLTDKVACIIDLSAVYKLPILTGDGTYAITDIGDTCDIGVTSYVQGALLQSSGDELFIILNGDADNNEWCIVRLNPNVQGETDSA